MLFRSDPKTHEVSSGYKESGYYPEAVTNMLALLGWHPSGNQELFSMEELIAEFSLERVSKSGAKFDVQKALWFNQQYLQRKPLSEQYALLKPMVEAKGYDACQEYVEQVGKALPQVPRFSSAIRCRLKRPPIPSASRSTTHSRFWIPIMRRSTRRRPSTVSSTSP